MSKLRIAVAVVCCFLFCWLVIAVVEGDKLTVLEADLSTLTVSQ